MQRSSLIKLLIAREIRSRYKGSFLGIIWSLLTPLVMLALYTFVFAVIFKAKWSGLERETTTTEFAMILFAGITIHQIIAEVLSRAPTLIQSNKNYLTKVVFPLEILVPVSVGSSIFNGLISFLAMLVLIPFIAGGFYWTIIFLPLVILPLCILTLGLGWFLAALGVYIRDIGQILPPIITAMLFLAPIFFPMSILPIWLQPWVKFNPITVPVEQAHNVIFYGHLPNFYEIGIYTVIAVSIALLGYLFFQKTRKGFADVI